VKSVEPQKFEEKSLHRKPEKNSSGKIFVKNCNKKKKKKSNLELPPPPASRQGAGAAPPQRAAPPGPRSATRRRRTSPLATPPRPSLELGVLKLRAQRE